MNLRLVASNSLYKVLFKKLSLTSIENSINLKEQEIALYKEICYGTCRYLTEIEIILNELKHRKLKPKVYTLLLISIYQLKYLNKPEFAIVNESVKTCALIDINSKSLVNAILREYIRRRTKLNNKVSSINNYNHPKWMLELIKNNYPDRFKEILKNNNLISKLWIRINQRKIDVNKYLKILDDNNIKYIQSNDIPEAISVNKTNIQDMPYFKDGFVSVQSLSAQYAAHILPVNALDKVLDACSAPGGKTCHLLEKFDLDLTAIDKDVNRAQKIKQNLTRLGLEANVQVNDILKTSLNNKFYQAILLDAPCSALGVIKKHPDIKWLRNQDEIQNIIEIQKNMLDKAWEALSDNGYLLYATCSILVQENENQISNFLKKHPDAKSISIKYNNNSKSYGWQILPSEDFDGFYYALLKKRKFK